MRFELCPGLRAHQRLTVQHLAPSNVKRSLSSASIVEIMTLLDSNQPRCQRYACHEHDLRRNISTRDSP